MQCGIRPIAAAGGIDDVNGYRVSRTTCVHFAHASRGVIPPGQVPGDGQQSAGPEAHGCGGEYAQIFRIARRRGSPGRLDRGGSRVALVGDKDNEARATYKRAKKQGVDHRRKDGFLSVSGHKVKGGVRTLNGFNRRAGMRDRCYRCDIEYHSAPKSPWQDTPRGSRSPRFQWRSKVRKPSFRAFAMEIPVSAEKAGHADSEETKSVRGQ